METITEKTHWQVIYWLMWNCSLVAMTLDRSFYDVERKLIGWLLDGAVPLWGSFMIRIVLPCIRQAVREPVGSSWFICAARCFFRSALSYKLQLNLVIALGLFTP